MSSGHLAADGVKMRLQDYINMTASASDTEAGPAPYLGTVYTEIAFLRAFASEAAGSSDRHQHQQLLSATGAK